MAIYRANITFQYDSGLPRDGITITPHFGGDNPQALADALEVNLKAFAPVANTVPFKIKVYDAQKPPPNYPLAEAENGTGFVASTSPRELALCLSYYSTWNRPRYRGRLYLPAWWFGATSNLRPSAGQITAALGFKSVLTNGLPPSHNWCVYSERNGAFYGVSNCWVDDEWDIVRTRGLRGTTRQTATVPQVAARAYSIRVGSGYNATGWTNFSVPAGTRLVIKEAALLNLDTVTALWGLQIGTAWALYEQLPVINRTTILTSRLTCYAGEFVGMWTNVRYVSWAVNGYLFDDDGQKSVRELPPWEGPEPPHLPTPAPEGPTAEPKL